MGIASAALSPDGKRIAAGGRDNLIKIWDQESGKELISLGVQPDLTAALAFSHDGKLLASGGAKGTLKLWNSNEGRQLRQFFGQSESILDLKFSPNDAVVASAGDDRVIRLWDVQSGRQLQQFRGHSDRINSIAFSKWTDMASGVPALVDAVAALDCEIFEEMTVGQHSVFFCEVRAARLQPEKGPLVHFNREFCGLLPLR